MHPKAKKRIVVLAVSAGVLAAAVGGVFTYRKVSLRAEYAALREQGLAASRSGDHVSAVDKLGRYLLRSPDDVEVLVAFARSREEVPLPGAGHLRQARDVYLRAVGLDGSLVDERARLASLMAEFGQLPEAVDQAERVLAVRPDDRTALGVRAVVLHRLRRFAEAQQAGLRWSEVAPDDVRSLSLPLASAKENRATEAELRELAGVLEKRARTDKGLAVVRGTLALVLGDGEGARRWWLEAAKGDPVSTEEATFIGEQLQNVRLPMESAEYLVRAASMGKLRGGKLVPARRLLELQRYDLLNRFLEDVRADDPAQSPEMLAMKAMALAGTGHRGDAGAYIDALSKRTSAGGKAWTLAVGLMLGERTDDVVEVRRTVEEALREGETAPMLTLMLADAVARQGEVERAVRMFDALAEASTGWSRPMERKAHYQATLGQFDSAFQSAVEAVRRGPQDPAALTTLASVWTSGVEAGVLDNRAELLKYLEELSSVLPGEMSTVPMRVLALARAGQTSAAKSAVEALVSAARSRPSPAWASLLLRTASVSVATGLGEEMRLLELAEELGGVTPMSALTRAMLEVQVDGVTSAVSRFEGKRRTDGPEAKAWAVAWATLLEAVGDARAAGAWKAASEAFPQDLSVQRDVLASRAAQQDLELRRAALERLRPLAGEGSSTYRMADAQLALDTPGVPPQRLSEVVDRLTELLRTSPGNSAARVLLARAQERLGNTAQAIEQLRSVPATAPEATPARLMLAELLQRNGDFAAAERALQEALERGQMGANELRGAAVLRAEQGDARGALELLSRSGGDKPDLMRVQLLRQANDLARAEEEARRLVEAEPTVVSVRTLAEIQRARGNVAGATATLARLETLNLPPGVKELALVDYHMRFLELPLARRQAQLATEAAPDNPVTWQALLTVQAAQGDINAALETVERAGARLPNVAFFASQRALADRMRVAATDPVLVPVVLALLQDPSDAALVEALSVPTSGAISEGGPSAAASRVRQLAEKHPQSLPVQMLAVRRLVQLSQLEEAGRLASKASEAFPTSPEAPALAAAAFASAGNWTQAVAMARIWRERSGVNPLPADLSLSEALVKVGRLEEAAAAVEPYVRGFTEDPVAYLPALFRRAEIASLLNQDEQALRLLAPVLSGRPENWVAWLAYVADRLSPERALRWAALAEASPEGRDPLVVWQAALVRANALTAMKSPEAAAARQRVAELARAEGRGGEFLASAALVMDLAGDVEQAERLYREAMEAGVRGVAVRNNLAMVLVRKGGDLTEARRLAEGVVAEAGTLAAFVDTLGTVLAAAGDYANAEQTLVRAVNLEPANVEWWVHLAEIQVKAGRVEEARATLGALASVREDNLPAALRQRLSAVRSAVGN